MNNISKFAILAAAALFVGSTAVYADAIPYPHPGTVITSDDVITATGSSTIYFYGFSAADTDYVNVIDTTHPSQSGLVFVNKTTGVGTALSLVTMAGDNLVVELYNSSTGSYFYSGTGAAAGGNPAPEELVDHAYVTGYSGGTIGSTVVGSGLFVGMEDLGRSQGGDYDYNDDQFVLTGVVTPGVPEPSSLMLLGTGLMSAAGMMFRRRRQTV